MSFLEKIKQSHLPSTLWGIALGAAQAANVDYAKLLAGDETERGKLIAAVATAVIGFFFRPRPAVQAVSQAPIKPNPSPDLPPAA